MTINRFLDRHEDSQTLEVKLGTSKGGSTTFLCVYSYFIKQCIYNKTH